MVACRVSREVSPIPGRGRQGVPPRGDVAPARAAPQPARARSLPSSVATADDGRSAAFAPPSRQAFEGTTRPATPGLPACHDRRAGREPPAGVAASDGQRMVRGFRARNRLVHAGKDVERGGDPAMGVRLRSPALPHGQGRGRAFGLRRSRRERVAAWHDCLSTVHGTSPLRTGGEPRLSGGGRDTMARARSPGRHGSGDGDGGGTANVAVRARPRNRRDGLGNAESARRGGPVHARSGLRPAATVARSAGCGTPRALKRGVSEPPAPAPST